jgi:hypothetical protein
VGDRQLTHESNVMDLPDPGRRGEWLGLSRSNRAIPNYSALRTTRYNYVEYGTSERKLYDLNADPTELTNIHASASPTLLSDLRSRLDGLRGCRDAD